MHVFMSMMSGTTFVDALVVITAFHHLHQPLGAQQLAMRSAASDALACMPGKFR